MYSFNCFTNLLDYDQCKTVLKTTFDVGTIVCFHEEWCTWACNQDAFSASLHTTVWSVIINSAKCDFCRFPRRPHLLDNMLCIIFYLDAGLAI